MIARSRRKKIVSGSEYLIGARGVVVAWDKQAGQVRVEGETWAGKSAEPISAGQNVEVQAREGLTLQVVPIEKEV